jgi:hypothetical protein
MIKFSTYDEYHNPNSYASSLVVQKEMERLNAAGQLTPELKVSLDRALEFLQNLEEQD